MYLLFFLIWIVFNGRFTWEIAAFGAVLAGVMYWFICRFLSYRPVMDIWLCRKSWGILHYIFVLIREIVKANLTVIGMIFSSKYELEPVVVRFKVNLKTNAARVALADSITLTPGTITVSQRSGEYIVHCLDKSLAEGLDRSVFVELLERLEGDGT
ncbi:MAG: Na+/H+ antiporter subunit E [Butyrivibrio sp.]|nr:Na+/H+ antiporter subunit E [Muribaculum sp.]MCM1553410.1 Na+/H+ antiporter subunit E [Butyrivibrio sp.]